LFGGGAGSDLWCQIIADVIARPVSRMESSDTALIGAARLAFESVGMQTAPARVSRVFEPFPERAARYSAAYADYMALREKICG
ncbi:MAG: hypothetical protein LIP23_09695, partial [Planctomycetes bacterium]|nr:hypothetical protein [Planctomycetota bacterium]